MEWGSLETAKGEVDEPHKEDGVRGGSSGNHVEEDGSFVRVGVWMGVVWWDDLFLGVVFCFTCTIRSGRAEEEGRGGVTGTVWGTARPTPFVSSLSLFLGGSVVGFGSCVSLASSSCFSSFLLSVSVGLWGDKREGEHPKRCDTRIAGESPSPPPPRTPLASSSTQWLDNPSEVSGGGRNDEDEPHTRETPKEGGNGKYREDEPKDGGAKGRSGGGGERHSVWRFLEARVLAYGTWACVCTACSYTHSHCGSKLGERRDKCSSSRGSNGNAPKEEDKGKSKRRSHIVRQEGEEERWERMLQEREGEGGNEPPTSSSASSG